jgi:hypothetical protein
MSLSQLRSARIVAAALFGLLILDNTARAGGSLKDDTDPAQVPERAATFAGVDLARGAQYYFDGIVVALNGDMSKDGFLLRTYGSRVDFDLTVGDGRGYQTDLMVGYKFDRGTYGGAVFVGADWQNYKLKPDDPLAQVRGTEFGVKVAANIETSKALPYYLGLNGAYSTAFDSFWTRLRAGLNRNHITFGPEAIVMGNTGFDAQRIGGFVSFSLDTVAGRSPVEITLSSGHQFVNGSNANSATSGTGGGEGIYGGIALSTTF